MKDLKFFLKPKYDVSRALIIGINKYQSVSPLAYAVSDAEEIKNVLESDLGFEESNVICLLDEKATKDNILKAFLSFTNDHVKVDDRLVVFFAGHGHTRSGVRGEVGYLVPYDANMDDYSSFIRWDELTRNSELVRAKHILFIMDACYGGLAVHRHLPAGSSRFLKDMYLRLSRQVITAGKANEVVSDFGGPLPNHSVFTGHLIQGIQGKAANEFGVITASGLMSYVYSKVANDIHSEQTPHYGQFDGDGDFIITAPNIEDVVDEGTKEIDSLMAVPVADSYPTEKSKIEKIKYTKELLSSETSEIALHDFLIEELRIFIASTSEDNFKLNGQFTDEIFQERLTKYEDTVEDLSLITACISYWAKNHHHKHLNKIINRSIDRLIDSQGGLTTWLSLRWYPILVTVYNAGVAAVDAKNYESLVTLFNTKTGLTDSNGVDITLAQKLSGEIVELTRSEVFKRIPGHERQYTPISEYLYKLIQPNLDDMLFLGRTYEEKFDEFEVLYALSVADVRKQNNGRAWGPIGRFGWKHHNSSTAPFMKIFNEAELMKNEWLPIKAGMFNGDYNRFKAAADEYKKALDGLSWF